MKWSKKLFSVLAVRWDRPERLLSGARIGIADILSRMSAKIDAIHR
jgi:hypothetical protein